jgi:hypothetical protein
MFNLVTNFDGFQLSYSKSWTHNLASSGKNVYDDFINIVFLDLNLCIKGILKSWNIERAPSKGIF